MEEKFYIHSRLLDLL